MNNDLRRAGYAAITRCECDVIDPTDSTQNTWYAGVLRCGWSGTGNEDGDDLYRTTNRGVTLDANAAWSLHRLAAREIVRYRLHSITIDPVTQGDVLNQRTPGALRYAADVTVPGFSSCTDYQWMWRRSRIAQDRRGYGSLTPITRRMCGWHRSAGAGIIRGGAVGPAMVCRRVPRHPRHRCNLTLERQFQQ